MWGVTQRERICPSTVLFHSYQMLFVRLTDLVLVMISHSEIEGHASDGSRDLDPLRAQEVKASTTYCFMARLLDQSRFVGQTAH